MAQYKDWTVSVTNGSPTVTGYSDQNTGNSTKFNTNVQPGDLFKIIGEATIYHVATVVSDTVLTLSVPYAGLTATSKAYLISRDFTPNLGLTEIHAGDLDWPQLLTEGVIRKIDAAFATRSLSLIADSTVSTAAPGGGGYFFAEGNYLHFQGMYFPALALDPQLTVYWLVNDTGYTSKIVEWSVTAWARTVGSAIPTTASYTSGQVAISDIANTLIKTIISIPKAVCSNSAVTFILNRVATEGNTYDPNHPPLVVATEITYTT